MVILLSPLCQVTLSGISTEPLPHPLLLVPVGIECALGRQAGRQAASFWTAQGTKINDFFRKRLHARLLWGYVQFKRYNTAPLYLARLTYAGFVLCHFGCRIYV